VTPQVINLIPIAPLTVSVPDTGAMRYKLQVPFLKPAETDSGSITIAVEAITQPGPWLVKTIPTSVFDPPQAASVSSPYGLSSRMGNFDLT
jgi:hypothetical protein